MAAGHEVGRELDAQQAVLLALRDRHAADLDGGLRGRLPEHHAPVAFDVEHAPVGGDVELERVLGVVVERDLLEVGGARRGHASRAAAGAGEVGDRPDAAQDVSAELRLGEGRGRVAAARVPRVAAVEVGAPRDRVVVGLGAAVQLVVGRLVERGQHVDVVARAVVAPRGGAGGRRLVVVPLVRARPAGRESRGGGVRGVLDVDRRGWRAGRVRGEVGPHQVAVPVPGVLRVGRGVDADVAIARPDVALEGVLLQWGQDVAGGGQPDDRVVLREVHVRERGRVLGGVDRESVGGADLLDCRDACRNRVVAEAGGLGEDEDPLQRCGGGGVGGEKTGGHGNHQDQQHEPGSTHVRFGTLPTFAVGQPFGIVVAVLDYAVRCPFPSRRARAGSVVAGPAYRSSRPSRRRRCLVVWERDRLARMRVRRA
jgi:hypothetical protein